MAPPATVEKTPQSVNYAVAGSAVALEFHRWSKYPFGSGVIAERSGKRGCSRHELVTHSPDEWDQPVLCAPFVVAVAGVLLLEPELFPPRLQVDKDREEDRQNEPEHRHEDRRPTERDENSTAVHGVASEAVGAAGLQLALASRRGKRRQRGAEADRAPEEQSDANGKQQGPSGVGDQYKCVWAAQANEDESAIAASNTTWTATQPPPLARGPEERCGDRALSATAAECCSWLSLRTRSALSVPLASVHPRIYADAGSRLNSSDIPARRPRRRLVEEWGQGCALTIKLRLRR